jgi:hypothetical protein
VPNRSVRTRLLLPAAALVGALLLGAPLAAQAASTPAAAPSGAASTVQHHRVSRPVAYWFCRATVYRWAAENPGVDAFTVHSYRLASITRHGTGWRVVIVGKPHARYDAHTPADWCDVTGTDARPVLAGGLMPR